MEKLAHLEQKRRRSQHFFLLCCRSRSDFSHGRVLAGRLSRIADDPGAPGLPGTAARRDHLGVPHSIEAAIASSARDFPLAQGLGGAARGVSVLHNRVRATSGVAVAHGVIGTAGDVGVAHRVVRAASGINQLGPHPPALAPLALASRRHIRGRVGMNAGNVTFT